MSFFDKAKQKAQELAAQGQELASVGLEKGQELASEGIEKSQELAKSAQLKLDLHKLEGKQKEAHAAYGKRAFELHEAGTVSGGELDAERQAIRDLDAQIAATRAEIEALGGDPDVKDAPAEQAPAATAPPA